MLRVLVLSLAVLASQAWAAAPAEVVTGFHDSLVATMRDGARLGCAGRAERLAPAIDKAFDVPALTARVLRRQWPSLNETQRKDFTAAFRELVIATYASRFAAFHGERFETLDTVAQPGDAQLVHARLYPKDAAAVSFDYVMHPVGGEPKIVNVVADGVSDLALRSSQYEQIVKQKGFDGLLTTLKTQTADAKTCK